MNYSNSQRAGVIFLAPYYYFALTREPRDRESACERFIEKTNGFTALFMGNPPLDFDEDTGKPKRLNISTHIHGSVPQEDTRLDL